MRLLAVIALLLQLLLLRGPAWLERSSRERLCADPLLAQPLALGPALELANVSGLRPPAAPGWRWGKLAGKLSAPSAASWKSGRPLPGRDRPLGGGGNAFGGNALPAAAAARGEPDGDGAALSGRERERCRSAAGAGEMLGMRLGERGVCGRDSPAVGVPGVGGRGSRVGMIARMRGDPGCEDAEVGRGMREGELPAGEAGRLLTGFRGWLRCWLGHGCGPSIPVFEGAACASFWGSETPVRLSLRHQSAILSHRAHRYHVLNSNNGLAQQIYTVRINCLWRSVCQEAEWHACSG